MAKQFGLSRNEKLKSRKAIDSLFARGKSFVVFPLRISYSTEAPGPEGPLARIGVTASKRHFKKAVARNRIKRLLREAYRLQKHSLLEALERSGTSCNLFFMYTDKTIAPFSVIQATVKQCLDKLEQRIAKNENAG